MPVNENKGGVPALCGLLLGATFHINSKQKKQLRKFEKKCIMEKNTLYIQGHKTDIANVPNEITKWAEVARYTPGEQRMFAGCLRQDKTSFLMVLS